MDNDPGIVCIQHCNSDIFAFDLPQRCPVCRGDLTSGQNIPFRIPFPFSRASQQPCCVVLRPTHGDFLCGYSNAADLHIGVTDIHGVVHAYDERGLTSAREWQQCVAIPGLQQQDLMDEEWDASLSRELSHSQLWTADRYKPDSWNCYTFVLNFLRSLSFSPLSQFAKEKHIFCSRVLLPHTTAAAKYISLFRKVSSQGVFVQAKVT